MENLETKKSHVGRLSLVIAIASLFLTSMLLYLNRNEVSQLISSNKTNQEQIIEEPNMVETESVPTIQEILDGREYIKECQRIDSVFLTMPDVILIDILLQHGTSLSNSDIVTIYESNKERYNNVKSGAMIQQFKDSLYKIKEHKDTIPIQRE
jgi:hypothetical protein